MFPVLSVSRDIANENNRRENGRKKIAITKTQNVQKHTITSMENKRQSQW